MPMCKNRVCLPEFSTYIFKSSSVAMGKRQLQGYLREKDNGKKIKGEEDNRKTGKQALTQ